MPKVPKVIRKWRTAQGTRRTVKYEDAKLPFFPQTRAEGSRMPTHSGAGIFQPRDLRG
jgi:hypothetical protein